MKLATALLCFGFFLTSAETVFAAIPAATTTPQPAKILSEKGATAGGLAGTGFSLTDVTLAKTMGKERIVIDIGDVKGEPIRGYPGYYHAELQEKPNRLVIDFAQMPATLIDEKDINKKLKASGLIANSTILVDPTDHTLSLILDFKKKTKAQIFQVPGKKGTSRVVVDLL